MPNTAEKGFTLIEIIISIAILSFGIIGVYATLLPIINATRVISSRLTAVYLAQEGLEVVRNIRDNNAIALDEWSLGLTDCSLGCQADYKTGSTAQAIENQLQLYDSGTFLKINADGFYSYDAGEDTKFTRKITISQPGGADALTVTVSVAWDENGTPFTFEAEGSLYNWY